MVPLLLQDFYKYQVMFRGDYYKGATLFKGLLDNASIGPELVQTPSAMSAVFTDIDRSELDSKCAAVLAQYPSLYDTGLATFMSSLGISDTMLSIMNDTTKLKDYLSNTKFNAAMKYSPTFKSKVATRKLNMDMLMTPANNFLGDTTLQDSIVNVRRSTAAYSTPSVLSKLNAWNNATYKVANIYNRIYVSKFKCVLAGARLQVKPSGAYYAAILRYSFITDTVTLFMISDAGDSQGSYWSACPKPAYDASNDQVYMFYRTYNVSQWCCSVGTLTATETETTYVTRKFLCGAGLVATSMYAVYAVGAANGNGYLAYSTNNANGCYQVKVSSTAQVDNSALSVPSAVSSSSYLFDTLAGYMYYTGDSSTCYVHAVYFNGSGMSFATGYVSQYNLYGSYNTPYVVFANEKSFIMYAMQTQTSFYFAGICVNGSAVGNVGNSSGSAPSISAWYDPLYNAAYFYHNLSGTITEYCYTGSTSMPLAYLTLLKRYSDKIYYNPNYSNYTHSDDPKIVISDSWVVDLNKVFVDQIVT